MTAPILERRLASKFKSSRSWVWKTPYLKRETMKCIDGTCSDTVYCDEG